MQRSGEQILEVVAVQNQLPLDDIPLHLQR